MVKFLGKWISFFLPEPRLDPAAKAKVKQTLLAELQTQRVDGKPVKHRRLESLMLSAGTTRAQTKRLLREIGARPSRRKGLSFWTLDNIG